MKSIFTCLFVITSASFPMARREEYPANVRASVFENKEKAWQGLRETEKRQREEAACFARAKQNDTQAKLATEQKSK